MKLFVTVLVEGEYMPKILKKLSENNFHGSVMPTLSIKKAGQLWISFKKSKKN